MKRFCVGIVFALVSTATLATHPPKNPEPPKTPDVGINLGSEANAVATSDATAVAAANSESVSGAAAVSVNHNTVSGGAGGSASAVAGDSQASAAGGHSDASAVAGDATATGGSAVAHGSTASSGPSSSTADNALSLTQNYTHERSAPSVAQGALYAGQCVAAGNAGGSNTGGSAFLGLAFTPYECHLARQAAAYEAAGDSVTACEIRRRSPSMLRLKKQTGFEPPPCYPKVPVAPALAVQPDPVDTSQFVTKDDLAERDRRIIGLLGSK